MQFNCELNPLTNITILAFSGSVLTQGGRGGGGTIQLHFRQKVSLSTLYHPPVCLSLVCYKSLQLLLILLLSSLFLHFHVEHSNWQPSSFLKVLSVLGRKQRKNKQTHQWTLAFIWSLRLKGRRHADRTGSTPLVVIPDIMHRDTRLLCPLWCERS